MDSPRTWIWHWFRQECHHCAHLTWIEECWCCVLRTLGFTFMCHMGYTSCKADPDLLYKAETRPDDNFRYYAYILCYVDDMLCARLKPTRLENGTWAWGLSLSKYVAQAVKNWCEKHLTNWTTIFNYPSGLTTRSLVTFVLNWTYLTPLTQNAPHSINTLLVWWGGWLSSAALTLRLKSLSYPPTLRILAKDTLRQLFTWCLICVINIIHDLSLTWPTPKLTWNHFHSLIGPNSTVM